MELLDWFRVVWEEGGGGVLYLELRSGRGLQAFLEHLASGVDPYPGLERLALLGDNRDGTMHLLHLFGLVTAGAVAALPSSSLATPAGRVETFLILHLRFTLGVAG